MTRPHRRGERRIAANVEAGLPVVIAFHDGNQFRGRIVVPRYGLFGYNPRLSVGVIWKVSVCALAETVLVGSSGAWSSTIGSSQGLNQLVCVKQLSDAGL